MTKKIGRKWLLSIVAVPVTCAGMAWGGVASADPWLERSPTVGKGWDDLPFLGPQQKASQQRQPRSPETTRALESKRELQRELHRTPEVNRAANAKPAANVFPPPRLPSRPAAPPADTQIATSPVAPSPAVPSSTAAASHVAPSHVTAAPVPAAARSARPAQVPQPARTAAAHTRDGDQELQRELNRALPSTAVPPVTEPLACAERLAKIARYSPLPSRIGPGACGATDLVRLDSIVMPDRSLIALNPAPQIRCSMAEQFSQWVREDVGPAATEALGSPLMAINDYDAYDCRPRNNVKGAKLSEHGKGNALDLASFRLRNGGVFTLADQQVAKSFRDRVRVAACGRFMTVLGPGSDAYHGDHVHIDMAERSHNTKVCQWNVHETVVATAEPEPPHASAPPVAALPVVPPPPKVESKIESKIESKAEPKIESRKVEPKAEVAVKPAEARPFTDAKSSEAKSSEAKPSEAKPSVTVEPPAAEPVPPEVAEASSPTVEATRPAAEPAHKQAEQQSAKTPKSDAQKHDTRPVEVAAAPKEPEAGVGRTEQASPAPVPEASPAAAPSPEAVQPSPPLPRRKPEALLTLAQSEAQGRTEHAPRAEHPRYDPARRFERDVHRFIRNFF